MNHGGIRKGAGRPATPVDERRLLALRKEGLPMRAIAERFGVTKAVIRCALDRIKRNDAAST
jgi:transposase